MAMNLEDELHAWREGVFVSLMEKWKDYPEE